MNRVAGVAVAVLFFLCTMLCSAQVENQKLSGQSFEAKIMVDAPQEEVWNLLTDVPRLAKIMTYQYLSGAARMENVGDHARVKVWGDAGEFVTVFIKAKSEVRYSWEPDNGSYLCQERWALAASGKQTEISYLDRYTESGPQSPEDIAAQVKSYNEALQRLKTACENR